MSSDEELSGVELEGPTSNSTKKKSSSWRFPAMFTKSQNNPKPVPSKQSVFPNNGNILKKKARSTILSVLSKRQTQEKLFLGEKLDVHQNTSSSEPTFPQTKWTSEAKPALQRPTSFAVKSKSCQYAPSNQGLNSSESNDRVYAVNANEQDKFSSRVETPYVAQAGLDVLDGSTNVGKISSRWPPQQQNESLGWRRASAPKQLSCPLDMEHTVQVSDAMVVSMSPSYTSAKDISPDSPLSPKCETNSVKVSIPFQVQGQQPQAAKPDQRFKAWSSSVSICVPFQVNENNEGVSVLPSGHPIPLDSGSTINSLLFPDARASKDEKDGVAVTKPRSHSSPQSGRRKPPKEPHSKDKKATRDSPKTMGKEASKPHKPMDKAVSSTALKVPTGGKPRSQSFNVGDRAKLAPSPTGTPPTGTPKSSPGNSPKPARRNAMSKDMGKKRPSELKKQDHHGSRPYSDPLIAEKMKNKKKSTGVPANDTSSSGKSKPDTETLKNKVKDLEQKNNELKEKIEPMEHRLAVVSLLEKEKLHLQKQFNDITLENDKRKTELESLNLLSKKQTEERDEIQERYDKLTAAFENSQAEVKELKYQNHILEQNKSNLMQENEEKVEAIGKYLDNIENLTSSNTALVLQEGRLRSKISTLLQGLQSLKDCVIKLKEENKGLQSQIIENGSELAGTFKRCVSGLEKVLDSLEEKKNDKIEEETQVFISIENKDTQCDDSQSVDLILAQLEESKQSVECLKNRINELEKENKSNMQQVENAEDALSAAQNQTRKDAQSTADQVVNEENKVTDCDGCNSLQMQVQALSVELELVKSSLQKSESERDDAVEERNELRREAKYLKYVLSYREDVQNLKNTNQQAKELEKMGTNLVEAEKKVIDLEDEVGRLQEEKQTLLLSILNLYSGNEVEDVKEEDEDEDEGEAEDEMACENNKENKKQESKDNVSEVFEKSPSDGLSPRTPDSTSRREQLKFRFQLSLSESEYSYTSDRTEGEDELSDSESVTSPPELNVQAIKTENKQLKSNLFEANEEKEELLSSLDKLCEEYDTLKESHDKLEEDHVILSDQARKDKIAYQSRLRQIEMDRENMRDTLRQVQDEKLALLKCLEMKNSASQPMSPLTDLDFDNIIARAQSFTQEENNSSDLDLDKIIARAQSFTREENESSAVDLDKIIARAQSFSREETKSSEPTSNEEDSEASSSSETDDDDANERTSDKDVLEKKADVGSKAPATQTCTPVDRDLAGLVASIENDLGILKARLNTRETDTPGDGQGSRPRKPPPGARILKRQASTVKSNLDRVFREKQHLQDEVESLRRYLLKRRDSAMDLRKKRSRGSFRKDASEVENHLEGVKTLQALLGKSDEQLRQSNEIISRLEAVNDETEDKLRDAEVLREDMRRAVQIANNFAMEEQQKADELMLQNQELLKQIQSLKSTGAAPDQKDASDYSKVKVTPKIKSKFALKVSKSYNRSVSEDDYEDEESNFTTEGESDFYSSRHSSIASESELRSPREPSEDNMDTLSNNLESNLVSPSGQESTKSLDTEPEEGTSQHSSTLDTTDTE